MQLNCASPIFIIIGPPGSGKGTQGDLLEKNMGFKKISTGDILRAHVKNGTELGKKVSSIIDAGNFVSDEILAELVQLELKSHTEVPVLLDGYPRNRKQAEDFQNSPAFPRLVKVICLDVNKDFLINRILGRLVCPACGATFHLESYPPKVSGVCDSCSAALVTRNDDTRDKIEKRLGVYEAETEPLLSYYRGLALLESVDGSSSPAQVNQEIFNKLEDISKNKHQIS